MDDKTVYLEDMDFSVKIYSKLKRGGVDTLEKLQKLSAMEMLSLGLGIKDRIYVVSKVEEIRSSVLDNNKFISTLEFAFGSNGVSVATIETNLKEGLIKIILWDLEGNVCCIKNIIENISEEFSLVFKTILLEIEI